MVQEAIIVFKTFDKPINASIVKGFLNENGVPAFLENENMVNLNPIYNTAIGGVRLCIFEKHLEKATQIYKDQGLVLSGDRDPELAIKCKLCNSDKVVLGPARKNTSSWLVFTLKLMFLNLLPGSRKTYHCHSCGKEFKND